MAKISDKYVVIIEGIDDLGDIETLAPKIERAAVMSINSAANRVRSAASREILSKINFPARYLDPSQDRLKVSGYARFGRLEAVVTGRRRATSLARFATSGTPGKMGVTVSMRKGRSKHFERGFLMKLKSGKNIDTKSNLGLAVRTEKGKRPHAAYEPVKIRDGLWLLYGVSVDQAFRVARDKVRPEAEKYLVDEFNRLMGIDL